MSRAVVDELTHTLNSTRPSLADVAASLRTSSRTLRRRLNSEGVRFSELLDRARFQRATFLLLDTDTSLEQIAFSLQFSSASAFRRAFKRWTKIAPSDFRARARRGS
ncbi:MAG: helix-turn-helix domain-containing protein [Myxococcota bacterium]